MICNLIRRAIFYFYAGTGGMLIGASLAAADGATNDDSSLRLPVPRSHQLRVLSPTVLELDLVAGKNPDPAPIDLWDFVSVALGAQIPTPDQFVVTVDGQAASVSAVGFRRRPIYAPLAIRDLRVGNALYLQLATALDTTGAVHTVEVTNPDGQLWTADMRFAATTDPMRFSPVIHVNQVGYVPKFPKKAMIGYYLGSLGEMPIPTNAGFKVVDLKNGKSYFQGSLKRRPDFGYIYTPTPYQQVYEADFTKLARSGEYRLVIPGLGSSYPFFIHNGVAMAFARAYALGLYHQRCGTNNVLPYTRHTHDVCHAAPVEIPSPQSSFANTWSVISAESSNYSDNPRHTAPQLKDEASQLYPFVIRTNIDTSRGHHDAGDYSKYTINSAAFVHHLVFAVDSLSGVSSINNLGIPESRNGKPDLLDEAKWEADFLAKLQDSDGGFYFLVYPRNRRYENNVTPDHGDSQIVWPKTTAVTAAAVAALAQCASSRRFRSEFPKEAALYLQKAKLGWQFLTNAIARYGKDGAYQKITQYGHDFMHDDELAWAACEMFLATGDQSYHQKLKEWFPNPNDAATYRWGWWRLFVSYGNAIRSYAFAVRTGRLKLSQLDPAYLARCEAEIRAAANDHLNFATNNAYGTSFPFETKRVRAGGWYFSSERAFDITVAYQLEKRPEWLDAILSNLNYEAGCNPVNVSYITGLGWKRQREVVHQYAQNDRHVLPPSGLPQGNIQASFDYLFNYKSELGALSFPEDGAPTAPYPIYDRWGDTYNLTTEFVIVDQARSLASMAWLAAQTSYRGQSWRYGTARITGLAATALTNTVVRATVQTPGRSLTGARVVWEAREQDPAPGTTFAFMPTNYGPSWVEAEVQWPDGRRAFAATNFFATNALPTVSVVATTTNVAEAGPLPAVFTFTRTGNSNGALTAHYQLTGTATKFVDYRRPQGDMPDFITIPAGTNSATLTVVAVNDAVFEGTETVILTLSPQPTYNLGVLRSAMNTIADDDPPPPPRPTVTVIPTDANASETGPDTGAFTITRVGDTASALTVHYTLGGTAVNGTDYQQLSAFVIIPAGASSATVTVTPIDDMAVEDSETVGVTLVADAAYIVAAPNSVAITIADNDPPPPPLPTVSVIPTDADASEAGPDMGAFTITRTGDTTSALTVHYILGGTAADGTDYQSLPAAAAIPAGTNSAVVTVTPIDDTFVEEAETVMLTLSADAGYTVGSPGSATVTLADDDNVANAAVTTLEIALSETGAVTLTWSSAAGRTYLIEYKDDLGDPMWKVLNTAITATGPATTWTDATTGLAKQRFYAVREAR